MLDIKLKYLQNPYCHLADLPPPSTCQCPHARPWNQEPGSPTALTSPSTLGLTTALSVRPLSSPHIPNPRATSLARHPSLAEIMFVPEIPAVPETSGDPASRATHTIVVATRIPAPGVRKPNNLLPPPTVIGRATQNRPEATIAPPGAVVATDLTAPHAAREVATGPLTDPGHHPHFLLEVAPLARTPGRASPSYPTINIEKCNRLCLKLCSASILPSHRPPLLRHPPTIV